jgi:cyclopropane fatty-acyl-phospholipid synthase-like methyltransferase
MAVEEEYKTQSQKVAAYYDEWQEKYNAVYGNIIQAFRPGNADALMEYIAQSIGAKQGQQIIDAGCGIGGPATWLAENKGVQVNGVTISAKQVSEANEYIKSKGLTDKVKIEQGDYHEMGSRFENGKYDGVLFLESLGHSGNPAVAIKEAAKLIKPGGFVYIKDFYRKTPDNAQQQARIDKVIDNINRLYSYNCLDLNNTIDALRKEGLEIDYIRKFGFKDDIGIRFEFESRYGIDIFGGEPEFTPAEWLEIRCIKPEFL